jgi:hypothetical protein
MWGDAEFCDAMRTRARGLLVWLTLGGAIFGWQSGSAQAQDIAFTAVANDLYSVELTTGDMHPIGNTGFEVVALAISPDHGLFGVESKGRLLTLDPSTGQSSVVGPLGVSVTIRDTDLAFDGHGQLWMLADRFLYTVDTQTGAATAALGPQIPGIGLAWYGSQMYTADDRLYLVDPTTGDAVPIGSGSPISYSVNLSPYRAGTLLSMTAILAGPNVFYQADAVDIGTGERRYLFTMPNAVGLAVQPTQPAAVPGGAGYASLLLILAMAATGIFGLRGLR